MPVEKKKSPWRRILWISGLFLAALLGATIYAQSYQSTTAKDLAAIRAQGIPTAFGEIKELYPREQGDNSAPYYDQFLQLLKDVPDADKSSFSEFRNSPLISLSDEQLAAAATKY